MEYQREPSIPTSRLRPRRRRTGVPLLGTAAAAAAAVLLSACVGIPPVQTTEGTAPPSSTASPSPSVEPPLPWGPSRKNYDDAAAAVAQMTVEQKAGQIFIDYYTGTDPTAELAAVKDLQLGGVILFADNLPVSATGGLDTQALADLNARFSAAAGTDRDWPAVISVDMEGGLVARLKAPLTEWPAPMTYGAAGSAEVARASQLAMNEELASLGFTMNFAPDTDVTIGPADPTIGARSYSGDPELVAAVAAGSVAGALTSGVLPTIKHFPGHGSVTTDSHLALPVQPATVAQLEQRDWIPFKKLTAGGAPIVMMGHIAVTALEPGVPASVSAPSYAALRGLGFQGVAVTDALNMAAVEESYPGGQAAAMALGAGADLLLMPTSIRPAHAAVVAAVDTGSIPMSRLDEAATKVVALMMWQATLAAAAQPAAVGSHEAQSKAASAAGLTVLEGRCDGAQLTGAVRVAGGTAEDRARFTAAARAAGLSVGSGPLVTLLGSGSATGTGDVVVALDAPWGLAGSASAAKLALYGRSPGAFAALLDFLTGRAGAPGNLPVAVGKYPVGTGCA